MTDIATLGIEAKASGVDQASKSLDKLTTAAKRAEAATESLGPTASNSGKMAANAANASANALNAEASAANRAAGALRAHSQAANQNTRGLVKTHNTANLAAQGFDIFTTAAGGMSAGLIGMQQGLQIAQVAMTSTDGFAKTLAASFAAMLSPVTFIAIGLTTLVAAGIQMVDWAKAGSAALVGIADGLEVIAPYATAAAGALALIYAPSIVVGMINIIALLARISVAALAMAASFTAAWLAALGPVGLLITGIAAVGTAAYLLRDEIKSAIGVDVVAIIRDSANFIVNSFEAVYSDIKFLWMNFPAIVGAAAYGAANLFIKGINQMMQKAAEAIDWLTGKANKATGTLGIAPIAPIGKVEGIRELTNPYTDGLSTENSTHAAEIARIMSQDRLSQFGTAIGEGASFASGKLKELAGWMTSVDEKGKKKRGGRTDSEKYKDIVDGANRRIASLNAEQMAVGLTEEAAAKLRYEQDLLNQAQRAGIELTPKQTAQLKGLAATMAATEAATLKAQEALDFAKDATGGFFSDLRSGLMNGEGLWKSFANAATNALDMVIEKIQTQLIDAIFQVNNAASGGGGFWSSLFGGFLGGGAAFANSGQLAKGFAAGGGLYAAGGYTGNGSTYQPAGVVHKGEYVFSKAATAKIGVGNLDGMHRRAKGYASGGYVGSAPRVQAPSNGNQQNVQVSVGVEFKNNGTFDAYVTDVAQTQGRKEAQSVVKSYDKTGAMRLKRDSQQAGRRGFV
ncbi:phage tail tape-measure protein [Phyllobacterium phragmitis]|uniref:Phage tail tape-measure protein n=1 Tax=Phyllobacterium phragmitis TaxID=2670329 RepID=A0A2S9INQ0_9HYPH|nr:phage tail tape-measure protein [Phyllobacterium phragmitis]PRD42135.1 phage tail tape-measure protein [Phyllobacterium phragmitis]